MGYAPRLRGLYRDTVLPALIEEFNYDSVMQVPRLTKILLSMGVGLAPTNRQLLDTAVSELTLIAGQRAVTTRARRSIAAFKIRAGMEIGAMVTLRGDHMLEFFDRFVNVAVPRIKDFRGLSPNSFDGRGNYSVGVDEQIIFSEIDYDRIDSIHGLNITIVTSARTDREGPQPAQRTGNAVSQRMTGGMHMTETVARTTTGGSGDRARVRLWAMEA